MALHAALLLTPDDRTATRRAVMRASVVAQRNEGALRALDSKRILRGFSGAQRRWIALGVGMYQVFYNKPLVPLLFAACAVLFAVQLIASIL